MPGLKNYIHTLINEKNLAKEDAAHALHIILNGGATPIEISSFLTAWQMKGAIPEEIIAMINQIKLFYQNTDQNFILINLPPLAINQMDITLIISFLVKAFGQNIMLSKQINKKLEYVSNKIGIGSNLNDLSKSFVLSDHKYFSGFKRELTSLTKELPFYNNLQLITPFLTQIECKKYILILPDDKIKLMINIFKELEIKNYIIFTSDFKKCYFKDKSKNILNTDFLEVNHEYTREIIDFISYHPSRIRNEMLVIASWCLFALEIVETQADAYNKLEEMLQNKQIYTEFNKVLAESNS